MRWGPEEGVVRTNEPVNIWHATNLKETPLSGSSGGISLRQWGIWCRFVAHAMHLLRRGTFVVFDVRVQRKISRGASSPPTAVTKRIYAFSFLPSCAIFEMHSPTFSWSPAMEGERFGQFLKGRQRGLVRSEDKQTSSIVEYVWII